MSSSGDIANNTSPQRRGRQTALANWLELLGSMRFAISLLTLICIASAIGTVVGQSDPWVNYVNQFGPFWASFFEPMGLFRIYNAPWFIAVMAFLVVSTSLCVYRNTPKMIKEMRVYRENIRESSLKAFAHRWEGRFNEKPDVLPGIVTEWLEHKGFKVKQSVRENGTMVAAKAGSANRFGYIAAHLSIIVICVGGLLDSGVPLQVAVWATGKTPVTGAEISQGIPEKARLGESNPSYRANLLLPEGETSRVAVLNTDDGLLIQDLPFELTLKEFRIDFYSTGMPKLFASDVVVFDPETQERFEATIEVNKPLIYKGVTVYQSSFDDGGTKIQLKGIPLTGERDYRFDLDGVVGGGRDLSQLGEKMNGLPAEVLKVEFTAFKSINVEALPVENSGSVGVDDLALGNANALSPFETNLASVLGPGVKEDAKTKFTNIGPAITYKLRDESGQAREFHNYMLPINLDGGRYYLAGVRDTPADGFKYLRIPVDDNGQLDGFMRFRAALQSDDIRRAAAQQFALQAFGDRADSAQLVASVSDSARRALERFAGVDGGISGLPAIAQFIESTVPEGEREKASDVIIRLLQGAMWEVYQLSRTTANLAPAVPDEVHGRFVQDAQIALSDLSLYGAPVMFQLDQFDEVKASVFQLAKAPGQWIVYLGCLFLCIGVFSMFYIRERRAFFWVTRDAEGSRVMMGMSTTRKTMDFEKEYEQFVSELNSRATTKAAPAGDAV
ncbi:MAG: cytochrome c biogenesis protein ResB [Limnobacter sp.]|uniref:cytochrome c biogenesis protein ResB n=1 Tax=Limnobacter sp. TaxID=2003368 RepID=UPI0022C8F823|nr:cytochrome c biogenesis protein ResB [Limnobacter sp.]MCZ8015072.1 cytochrome c biogenesis protein ResB [Limnobacter sp.]